MKLLTKSEPITAITLLPNCSLLQLNVGFILRNQQHHLKGWLATQVTSWSGFSPEEMELTALFLN